MYTAVSPHLSYRESTALYGTTRRGGRKIVAVIGSLTVNGPLTDEHWAEDTGHWAPIWPHDWSFLHFARVRPSDDIAAATESM